jgi:hypothetical protein
MDRSKKDKKMIKPIEYVAPEEYGLGLYKGLREKIGTGVSVCVDFGKTLDHSSFEDFLVSTVRETRVLPHVKADGSNVIEFDYGCTNYTNAADLVKRRNLFEKLNNLYPGEDIFCNWKNQSFAQMASDIFAIEVGELEKSFDSCYDREIINKYRTSHIIGLFNENLTPEQKQNEQCIDLNKCYLNVILESAGKTIPIFQSTDSFRKVTDEDFIDESGYAGLPEASFGRSEYVVDAFTHNGIVVQSQIFNSYTVAELLELEIIKPSMIRLIRTSHRAYRIDPIVRFAQYLKEKFPDELKYLYTTLVGGFGIRSHKGYKAELTTDEDFFNNFLATEGARGKILSKADRLYLMSRVEYNEIPENNAALYRYIVGQGEVKLLKLSNMLTSYGCSINAARVDCLYINKLDPFTQDQEAEILKIAKFEKKQNKFLAVKRTNSIKNTERDQVIPREKREQNLRVQGIPGSGKSTRLANSSEGCTRVLNLAFTRLVSQNMRQKLTDKGINNVSKTFDMFYATYLNWTGSKSGITRRKAYQALIKHIDLINVDEFSMMHPRAWNVLNQLALTCNPGCTIRIYGDINQIGPIGHALVDPAIHPMALYLFPNGVNLEYIPESARYEPIVHAGLEQLLKTGTLSEAFLSRVQPELNAIQNRDDLNVCFTNKTRQKVINYKQALGVSCDRFIITENTLKYNRGELMTRKQLEELQIPTCHYQSGLCFTANKSQAQTFEQNYTIYEIERYSLQRLYVALSRARRLDQITIAGDIDALRNRVFKRHYEFPENETIEIKATGVIYKIQDDFCSYVYVGKTDKPLEERFAEHCDSNCTHHEPFSADTARIELICHATSDCIDERERYYINLWAAKTQDPASEIFGYEIKNKRLVEGDEAAAPQTSPPSLVGTPSLPTKLVTPLVQKPKLEAFNEISPVVITLDGNAYKVRVRKAKQKLTFEKTVKFDESNKEEKLDEMIAFVSAKIRENADATFNFMYL